MSPMPMVEVETAAGGRMVSVEGLEGKMLPLVGAALRVEAEGGIARVVLEQRFANPHDEPLAVTYLLPLPADGAVAGFAFRIGERRVVGEVDRRGRARERFEEALVEGRTAALLDEERSSLFQQQLGNIPPRTEIVAEISIDQTLAWLDEGEWEWRFPTAAAPRYLGAPGTVADASRVSITVADAPLPARLTLALTVGDRTTGRPASPSHALAATAATTIDVREGAAVTFADAGGVALDRDVVVRWPVATREPGLVVATARPAAGHARAGEAFGLLTITPPERAAQPRHVPRDLILLLDTSGSMGGEPLDQARRIALALLDTLGDEDRLEMIEFSNEPSRWKRSPVAATAKALRDARAWLGALKASGGTEMRSGILEALRPLRADAQRQIVLVTDGLIGAEEQLVGTILRDLPVASRLHTVGVGSAVNRSLTGPAARAGKGVEVVVGLGEDPERAARRLAARTAAPLVVDVTLEGSALVEHAPAKIPDLYAGAPLLVALRLRPEGGALAIHGRTAAGPWRHGLEIGPTNSGAGSPAVVTLFGRERVEDLEARIAAAGDGRGGHEDSAALERIGLEFQIATRLTSWIAASDEPTVDPRRPTRREIMPQMLPHGISAAGMGLRPARAMMMSRPSLGMAAPRGAFSAPGAAPPAFEASLKGRMRTSMHIPAPSMAPAPPAPTSPTQRQDARLEERASTPSFERSSDDDARVYSFSMQRNPEPRVVHGRIALLRDGLLVIEWVIEPVAAGESRPDLPGEFDWSGLPEEFDVLFEGAEVQAELDPARSTAPGRYTAGQVLRLTLMLPPTFSPGDHGRLLSVHFRRTELVIRLGGEP